MLCVELTNVCNVSIIFQCVVQVQFFFTYFKKMPMNIRSRECVPPWNTLFPPPDAQFELVKNKETFVGG